MNTRILFISLALAFPASFSLHAQHSMNPMDPSQVKPLVERKDVVSWKTLAQVELVKQKDRYVPQFAQNVTSLDKKQVKMQGFMMPLQTGDKQSHFVLSAVPTTCSFCLPGGPESLVEVKAKTPVKYTFEPVIITGTLVVLRDDPAGIFYRLTDAVQSN